ncbi:integral membrane protein 2C [Copidosoma floridanum]|uniref:integral membrane protein 2C n=1 Tax=Copidosoma floridanum TaxID=29053 RepID=UPI0006C9CA97|nr:integral membrane protein 2C [Copidosoma floridanum]XP_014215966.1 integral membrane protein 2C [Copidosoma floridanum]XP_014215967.1 integral membrane protein 2C [Copidosoma floridanum]XP_014215968.1 integral membrane protein 2C [Copidosoma floridanum]
MTVITKAISEKKSGDKLDQPLVVPVAQSQGEDAAADPESQYPKSDYVIRKRFLIIGSNRLSNGVTTYCLFLTGLLVMLIGVFGGLCIYKLYTREQMHKYRTGWYTIPYDQSFRMKELRQNLLSDPDLLKEYVKAKEPLSMKLQGALLAKDDNYLQERFEIDLDDGYEDIYVPDFRGGRQGRFIHDFSTNKTGIIDVEGQCCFVMPLNRQRVLPPRDILDLLKKMRNGYYEVDTEVVRETMKIIFPPVTDYVSVGPYIARECQDMPTYLLQPVNEKVRKRSASDEVYCQFAGKNIIQFDIVNLASVLNKKN